MDRINSYCLAFLLFVLISLPSCSNKTTSPIINFDGFENSSLPTHFQRLYPNFSKQKLDSTFKSQLRSDSELISFYMQDSCKMVWFDDVSNISKVNHLIKDIGRVERHGLTEEYLGMDKIRALSLSIDSGIIDEDSVYVSLARLDYLMSKFVINYITGMNFGFLSPDSLFSADDYAIKTLRPDSLFVNQMYADIRKDAVMAVSNSLPTDSVYLAMQSTYGFWRQRKDDKLRKINPKAAKGTYALNEQSLEIQKIADRLIWTGEYLPDREQETDTLNRTLTKEMLAAVNVFRHTHSYPDDKNDIDPITIAAMNRDADYYLKKLTANMERYRWKRTGVKHNKHIEVNIAAFKLFATQPDTIPLIMKVCVGKTKHKTPTLQSVLAYINLNPVWNVPKSISRNEVFPLQRRDTSYLRRHNMRLYKGGEEVDYTTIDWKNERISERVYFVRQDAGPTNSLGRIKFMFANPFSVYLHDTPAQRAFAYFDRAVSHGCVRVHNPVGLAFFCTSPTTELYRDRLLYSIDRRPITKEGKRLAGSEGLEKLGDIVHLNSKPKISLVIDYYTIYMHPDNDQLYYADDVYGYDDVIVGALAGSKPKIDNTHTENELY